MFCLYKKIEQFIELVAKIISKYKIKPESSYLFICICILIFVLFILILLTWVEFILFSISHFTVKLLLEHRPSSIIKYSFEPDGS